MLIPIYGNPCPICGGPLDWGNSESASDPYVQCNDCLEIFRDAVVINQPSQPCETSVAAAEAMTRPAAKLRQALLEFIRKSFIGSTDEEAQLCLGMNPSTQRPRRVELVTMGLVRDSGRTRPTRSGRKAIVWEAV